MQRKVEKEDDDQSLIPIADFPSKTDNSEVVEKPVEFAKVKWWG